ncbi:unnamed protein product [Choristocarpus tenellus]
MVVAFKDIHPASTVHLLICPKNRAVRSIAFLTVEHADLLEHMITVGKSLLKQKAGLTENQQVAQGVMGFHAPPVLQVPHLHMHAIAPKGKMSFWSKLHFMQGSFWFQSADKVLGRLKSQQTAQITI